MTQQTHSLDNSTRYVKAVGPAKEQVLSQMGLLRVRDLLYFYPRRYEDRSIWTGSDTSFEPGRKYCILASVINIKLVRVRGSMSLTRAQIKSHGLVIVVTWFNQPYLVKQIKTGSDVYVYGSLEKKGSWWCMNHPQIDAGKQAALIHYSRLAPIYSLTQDINQKSLRQIIYHTLEQYQNLLSSEVDNFFEGKGYLSHEQAVSQMHFPESQQTQREAYRRLVLEEFLKNQIVGRMRRAQMLSRQPALAHKNNDAQSAIQRFIDSVPFKPTSSQLSAIRQIMQDMSKCTPMNRLVYGDVGSGKTFVAMCALLNSALCARQCVLMAPTEVLAAQHFLRINSFLEPMGCSASYLSSSTPKAARQTILEDLRSGAIPILIGTHALLSEDVIFKDLSLVVIDEQQRFGVHQRSHLLKKAKHQPHFLLLSATPIPRTLAIAMYGQLDMSLLGEKPAQNTPVKTVWSDESDRQSIYKFIESLIAQGQQGFIICPSIDAQGQSLGLESVQMALRKIKQALPRARVESLHGRTSSTQKKQLMSDMLDKKIDILVSTLVVEVGIDIPNATFMIVENSERFGLASLHQLRGRVGRGSLPSFCFLFSHLEEGDSSERLRIMQRCADGFEIAKEDMRLRGYGDLSGTRQHGMPDLKIGDIIRDADLFEVAHKWACEIVDKDPLLRSPKNKIFSKWMRECQLYDVSSKMSS